mmetsp:Transcript_4507/g.6742  ORF Transcript_4507/g.6742 Transcript_4507/m.6742 type:complete len:926 (+) Transcript_4507:43-2820(+)|eukprot:CAMPEP_0167741052 /NCGR_PEP_ID=MMETSP0110_2-20121227/640_1 /TAXON_ID=629695 /ORGANISM="Gymnochlora sp., Strain CCMP2014" /LENGTH=925 /DNA_ID=CAMNT_0007625057 /DNA_START=28 /DNA_END=2805 /DNA_ORIENTATION=+
MPSTATPSSSGNDGSASPSNKISYVEHLRQWDVKDQANMVMTPVSKNDKSTAGEDSALPTKTTWWNQVEVYFQPLSSSSMSFLKETMSKCEKDSRLVSSRLKGGRNSSNETIDELMSRLRKVSASNSKLLKSVRKRVTKWDMLEEVTRRRELEKKAQTAYQLQAAWASLHRKLAEGVRDSSQVRDRNKQKRASEKKGTKKVQRQSTRDEIDACGVCFGVGGDGQNPMIRCGRCGVPVHKACYGVMKIPLTSSWHCEVCTVQTSSQEKGKHKKVSKTPGGNGGKGNEWLKPDVCALCPVRGGAMKKVVEGENTYFVHVACALWLPLIEIKDIPRMSGITGVEKALNDGKEKDSFCSICKSKEGATVSCAARGCTKRFHPLCAWYNGNCMRVSTRSLGCDMYLFCSSHTPKSEGGSKRNLRYYREVREQGREWQKIWKDNLQKKSIERMNAAPELIEDLYERGRCAVCFEKGSVEGNRMLHCARCEVDVHQRCYGVLRSKEGELWVCDRCQARKHRVKPVSCVLCPRRGGAFKPTTDHKWVHVACARWIPEAKPVNPMTLSPIDLSRVPKARFHRKCYLCNQRQGACLDCAAGCETYFHVLCGLFSGAHMSIRATGNSMMPSLDNLAPDNEDYVPDLVTVCCLRHTPILVLRRLTPPIDYIKMVQLRKELKEAYKLARLTLHREKQKKLLSDIERNMFYLSRDELLEGTIPPTRKRQHALTLPILQASKKSTNKRYKTSHDVVRNHARGPLIILQRLSSKSFKLIRVDKIPEETPKSRKTESLVGTPISKAKVQKFTPQNASRNLENDEKQKKTPKMSGKKKLAHSKPPLRKKRKGVLLKDLMKKGAIDKKKASNKKLPPIAAGDKVLAKNGARAYEAFIMKTKTSKKGATMYKVHYHGWNKRYDEWVPESKIVKRLAKAEDVTDMQ